MVGEAGVPTPSRSDISWDESISVTCCCVDGLRAGLFSRSSGIGPEDQVNSEPVSGVAGKARA